MNAGKTDAERWGAVDDAAEQLTGLLGKNVLSSREHIPMKTPKKLNAFC
jgi:hypothetical protein